MKRKGLVILMTSFVLLIAGCGNLKSTGSGTSQTTTSNNKGVQTTGETGESNYTGVIEDGNYKTSAARGLTVSQTDNVLNVKSMETGLTTISKNQFSTDKYLLQEGQYLKSSTIKKWLARKSKSNPTGLNPAANDSTEADKRVPLYLQQVLEQDYVTQTDNDKGVKLGGISIALGMNSVDYYQKEQYGAEYKTQISDADLLAQGKRMANLVLKRLRQDDDLKNVPVVIALYKQASKDSLVGGTYVASSVNKAGTTKVSDWQSLNEKNQVLPTVGSEKAINSGDSDAFSNFKTQVQGFFPNLAGVVAQTHYKDNQLQGMKITINTQFYGETEITSFTQYVSQAAGHYLPSNIPIEITIQSTQGIQAFVARETSSKIFYTHVFGNY